MRNLIVMLAAALAFAGGAALASYGTPALADSASPTPAASDAAKGSPAPAAAVVVHIKNFAYVPETVTVAPGQSVRFVEDDEMPHTVTANDKSFDSGNLEKGRSWTHAFAKDGTYPYFCAYHTFMKGKVVVKAP